ncbi:GNAT family N-acetyltransferase [Piscibacillus salipiscarius]|uniref:GNAT family N-acetyltransferase n=1 Tax=Piscibacillus salipiscarius TaxID=299480 RepID=UPI0006CFB231|nr:GNAT family N-acetyltransferase [Piscibacillus salipiscarius]
MDVKLRLATPDDLDQIVDLDVKGFNLTREEAEFLVDVLKRDAGHRTYMIEKDGQTIGKLRLKAEGIETYIFGFTVDPDFRRQGIGKAALIEVVKQESESGHVIFVEVGIEDERGLHLYEAVGFETYQQQDYYKYQG